MLLVLTEYVPRLQRFLQPFELEIMVHQHVQPNVFIKEGCLYSGISIILPPTTFTRYQNDCLGCSWAEGIFNSKLQGIHEVFAHACIFNIKLLQTVRELFPRVCQLTLHCMEVRTRFGTRPSITDETKADKVFRLLENLFHVLYQEMDVSNHVHVAGIMGENEEDVGSFGNLGPFQRHLRVDRDRAPVQQVTGHSKILIPVYLCLKQM